MNKKIWGVFLALSFLLNTIPVVFSEYSDIEKGSNIYDSVSLLSDLNIISGYSDGSFKPYKTLSRAEFAKLIVMIYDKENEAKANSLASTFKDVLQGSWYTGYVNYIASRQIINGYADGTFAPDKPITYAEAVTILCRILGYKEEDVGYYWPNNYLNQAENLGLASGMTFNANDEITRGAAAVLIDRLLFTKVPESTANDTKLIESLGYTLLEDFYVIATRDENSSLTSKQVKTAYGIYEIEDGVMMPKAGMIGTAVLNKDKKITGIKEENISVMTAFITKVTDSNNIEYKTSDGYTGTYNFDQSFEVYVNYNKLSYQEASKYIDIDTEITFYGENYGEWEFAMIDNNISGNTPILSGKDYTDKDTYIGNTPINKENLKIYRNGESATLSDIKKNDVIYYNTKTNVIDVYNNKVSGVYTEAYPDKAHVTSVKVAGKTYELSLAGDAKSALDASDESFNIGEKVTLLLGKNDKVEFAVELAEFDYFDYGVLISCKKGISEDKYDEGISKITAEIFMPDGNIYTYTVKKNYEDSLKGKLVQLSYEGDIVTLSPVKESDLYGELDIKNRKFCGRTVLKDVKVIQRLSKEDADVVSVELLDFDTLGTNQIDVHQVINIVEANDFGDIGIMYLENMSGSYDYGFLLGRETIGDGEMSSYQYRVFSNGITTTYQSESKYNVTPKNPAYFKINGNSITEIHPMKEIAVAAEYEAIEGSRIKISGNVYSLSDDLEIIYIKNTGSSSYQTISIAELKKLKFDSIEIYSERNDGVNSTIRMIIVR